MHTASQPEKNFSSDLSAWLIDSFLSLSLSLCEYVCVCALLTVSVPFLLHPISPLTIRFSLSACHKPTHTRLRQCTRMYSFTLEFRQRTLVARRWSLHWSDTIFHQRKYDHSIKRVETMEQSINDENKSIASLALCYPMTFQTDVLFRCFLY